MLTNLEPGGGVVVMFDCGLKDAFATVGRRRRSGIENYKRVHIVFAFVSVP